MVQLNEYETAPDFLQLSQNMTSDCLFTCFVSKIVLFEHVNKTIFGAKQANSGKNTKVNKQSLIIFCSMKENMKLSNIH